MRENGVLSYIISDHLGSTSLVTDASGNVISETKYKAWGETRYSTGAEQTKYTYTGQYSYTSDFGLMFYNARWYDPYLARFAQADTIVPSSQEVQGYDRYAYVNNNPINYSDPTGHCMKEKDYAKGTLCYFQNMSWQERKDWLRNFANKNGLDNWFDDMAGAIDFMASDPSLSPEDSTTEVMDAAVLQAINDGWLIYNKENPVGGGGQGWADFFQARDDFKNRKISEDTLIATRLDAEQIGVDYAWGLTKVQTAYNNSSTLDQIYFDIFKAGADSYRRSAIDFRLNPLAVNRAETMGNQFLLANTDPRTSGPFLNFIGQGGYPAALFVWGQSQPRMPLSYP